MKKIYAFHLLNDFSGSPKVLSQLLKGWVANGYEVHLHTATNREGFLSEIQGVHYHDNRYYFHQNIILRLIALMWSQLRLITSMFRKVTKDDIIYINTVLPFGAGILGKLKACKVVYHIHETSVTPLIFKNFLFGIARWSAHETIYVSDFLAQQESKTKNKIILYNAIGDDFLAKARKFKTENATHSNVLMICSLKRYKGVDEFVKLAGACREYEFRLVVNASQVEIDSFFSAADLPKNLEIFPTQKNVHPFYAWADIVLNLSRPDQWVETFGLTAIEAEAYGLPIIVPPVGGISELIEDGIHGYKVDSREHVELTKKLKEVLSDKVRYDEMSSQALINIERFSETELINKSIEHLEQNFNR